MKRALLLFLIAWLALTGTIAVLASSPGVHSEPRLFSVIKTDRSKNATVNISGNRMWFTPGSGVGERLYGFQPGSSYHYRNLVRLQNNSATAITAWYTLEGELADLYHAGVFNLGLEGLPGHWEQSSGKVIEAGESMAPVNFTFETPPGQKMAGYSGAINWYAAVTEKVIVPPEEPGLEPSGTAGSNDKPLPSGQLPQTWSLLGGRLFPGLLFLLLAGLLLFRKNRQSAIGSTFRSK